jgi:hypothetical protein
VVPRHGRAGRPGTWTTGLLLSLLTALALIAGCTDTVSVPPPKPSLDNSSTRGAAAQHTLDRLVDALRHGRPSAVATLGNQALMDGIFANARALRLRQLSMRYVDEQDGALTAEERQRLGNDAWVAAVDVTYRIPGYDPSATHLETSFIFDSRDGKARIVSVGGHGNRSPSWLMGRLSVVRTPRTLVLASPSADARHFSTMAQRAVHDVDQVLTHWTGKLTIEVPDSERQMDQMLHATQEQDANIAAVTTTVTGTVVPGTPVHVFVNPRVFGTLRPKGAQVVLSHEATHVATQAAFADMPTWLLEGFADYVALDHAGVPVQVAAKQILARIRKDGPPRHLPTAADLSPTANGLGATYEEAWLACRYLGERYGENRLVSFYEAVNRGQSMRQVFHAVLGTTQEAFVDGWRADLRRLAA